MTGTKTSKCRTWAKLLRAGHFSQDIFLHFVSYYASSETWGNPYNLG